MCRRDGVRRYVVDVFKGGIFRRADRLAARVRIFDATADHIPRQRSGVAAAEDFAERVNVAYFRAVAKPYNAADVYAAARADAAVGEGFFNQRAARAGCVAAADAAERHNLLLRARVRCGDVAVVFRERYFADSELPADAARVRGAFRGSCDGGVVFAVDNAPADAALALKLRPELPADAARIVVAGDGHVVGAV